MKPDYKNWVPKGMVLGLFAGFIVFLALFLLFGVGGVIPKGILKTVLFALFLIATIFFGAVTLWTYKLHQAFDYNGSRQMARQIIDGVAGYVELPDGGKGLDVGCGSGALIIACAKRNPNAEMVGIDRWGKEYASFSKTLCENNAKAEGVSNVSFTQGDATKLDFPDETFDAVTSNYVYHNIPSKDRQAILLETLRTLKKGGIFAIHDVFNKLKYGDMNAFMEKLKSMGYEDVQLIDTTNGMFASRSEARWMGIFGSAILYGKK